jgi:hypothetical protein
VFLFSSTDGKILWEMDEGIANGDGPMVAAAGDEKFLFGFPSHKVGSVSYGNVELHASNDLWLDVDPTHFPAANDTLTLRANEGPPGNPAALFLTGVNGTPLFNFLTLVTFDATGSALFASATVPAGFAGNTLTLRAYAIGGSGKLVDSIDELLTLK